jgi:GH35 family endo-1,4-beta-xylanase
MRKINRNDLLHRLHVADQKVAQASDEHEAALAAMAESHWHFHAILDDPDTDEAEEVAAANYDDEMLHWVLAACERYRDALTRWNKLHERVQATKGETVSGNVVPIRQLH